MGIAELLLIAVGLSMDAFAVSICRGLGMRRLNLRTAAVLALFLGGFQGLMPLAGWALGSQFMGLIAPVDHWVAFVLLAFIGGKMLWEALFEGDEKDGDADGCDCAREDTSHVDLREFLVLAVATSIDALAAGISFAALSVDIVPTVTLIGVITFGLSLVGVAVGHFFGARYEKPASVTGGVVLILIGLKVLLEHLGVL